MDRRTKRQKLEAMANQTVSPHEAAVAREKLAALPPDPPRPAEYWDLDGPIRVTTYRTNMGSQDLDDLFEELLVEAIRRAIFRARRDMYER